jgi:hypothetical protein
LGNKRRRLKLLCFRPHLIVLHFWESAFSKAKKVVSLSKEGHLYLQLSN